MARTQILVRSWGPKLGFWRCFEDELDPCYVFYFCLKQLFLLLLILLATMDAIGSPVAVFSFL